MRLVTILSGAGALLLLPTAVLAADPLPPPPEVSPVAVVQEEPTRTWAGGYVGGHALARWGGIDNGLECYKNEEYGDVPIYFIVTGPG